METEKSPRVEIGSHPVIRHAYENVLNACARLGCFATSVSPITDGPVGRQQEILAIDDLVSFAIHGRRLIENTASTNRFIHVNLRLGRRSETISIPGLINLLVHHSDIKIVRDSFELELLLGRSDPIDLLVKYRKTKKRQFPAIVIVRSDIKPFISFELSHMVEIFQEKVLNPIIDLCAEHRLFLDDDF